MTRRLSERALAHWNISSDFDDLEIMGTKLGYQSSKMRLATAWSSLLWKVYSPGAVMKMLTVAAILMFTEISESAPESFWQTLSRPAASSYAVGKSHC